MNATSTSNFEAARDRAVREIEEIKKGLKNLAPKYNNLESEINESYDNTVSAQDFYELQIAVKRSLKLISENRLCCTLNRDWAFLMGIASDSCPEGTNWTNMS